MESSSSPGSIPVPSHPADTSRPNTSYQYPGPSLHHANQFRLIRLLPSTGKSDPTEVEFLAVDIIDPPSFEALSYTWGDSLDRREILVRTASTHSVLSVTANCLAALYTLRTNAADGTEPQPGGRLLWIDAICIDQANLGERHHQLSLMGRIFSAAKGVLIFLGGSDADADGDTDLAMEYIRELYYSSSSATAALEEEESSSHGQKQGVSNAQLYSAVKRLLARPWFRRVWVIQEALLAREATVICGSKTFPWQAMRELCAVAANPPTSRNFLGNDEEEGACLQTKDIPFVARARRQDFWPRVTVQPLPNQHEDEEEDEEEEDDDDIDDDRVLLLPFDPFDRQIVTFETLCRSRGCEATDPRDKIYALLPLLSSSPGSGSPIPVATCIIEPNYADPAAKVFVDCASYLLPYWGLQILCAVQSPPVTEGLPSWAPDWSVPPKRSILGAGASQRGSLGQRDRWGEVLTWLHVAGGSSDGKGNSSHASRGLLSRLERAAAWASRAWGRGLPSQPKGSGSHETTNLGSSPRSEEGYPKPRVVVVVGVVVVAHDSTETPMKRYELHTPGIFLGKIVNLAPPCDAAHLQDFPLTEWVDMAKRLVPDFQRESYYDPMAPKVFYDVVFAHEIGDGWYYYVDKSIRHTMDEAKLVLAAPTQEAARDGAASRWSGIEKTDFKASYGYSAMMWERCHGRRLFVTDTGYLGLGPAEARLGDKVYACPSANVPFVLRQSSGDGGDINGPGGLHHHLVGECFLEERMWDDIKSRNLTGPGDLEELVLV